MKKLTDWHERLKAFTKAMTCVPFVYGTSDCCLFAASAVAEMTGFDPAMQWRGTYHDAEGARAVLRKIGGKGVEAMLQTMAGTHGLKEVSELQRGDVLFIPAKSIGGDIGMDGFAGMSLGPIASAFLIDQGLGYLPLTHAARAWRIP